MDSFSAGPLGGVEDSLLRKITVLRRRGTDGDGRVRLAFTDCLGPCSEANVIFLYLLGRPLWFRRMNAPELVGALLDHCRTAEGGSPLPDALAARSFSWTGGGLGPAPPVDVPTSG